LVQRGVVVFPFILTLGSAGKYCHTSFLFLKLFSSTLTLLGFGIAACVAGSTASSPQKYYARVTQWTIAVAATSVATNLYCTSTIVENPLRDLMLKL
jgi:hypothetical protein